MADISTGDSGIGDIRIDNESFFSRATLAQLVPKTKDFGAEFNKPLRDSKLDSVAFHPGYKTPSIALDSDWALILSSKTEASLSVYRTADSPLLGKDDFTPEIPIDDQHCWVSFQTGASFAASDIGAAPAGVGVTFGASKSAVFTLYKEFGLQETVGDVFRGVLSEFNIPSSAKVIRDQKPGTVLTADASGSVTVSGEWSLPASVNNLALADTPAPIQIEVDAGSSASLSGSISISGEFIFRSWRRSETELVIGLYKKKGTSLSAAFSATAGLEAEVGSTDLLAKVFGFLDPKADTSVLGDDPGAIRDALKATVDHSLAASLNATCAAAFTDESAFVYTVDLSRNPAETDAALDAAIHGDWSKIAGLQNAKPNRNALGHAIDTNLSLTVNLLGVYSYSSVAEFISNCTVVHCPEDGSATITDKETAKRITAGAQPHRAAADQLRKALSEAAVATAAYTFTRTANKSTLTCSQTLVFYDKSADARKLSRELSAAEVLGLVTKDQVATAIGKTKRQHVLIQYQQTIEQDAAAQMFTNPQTGQPWTEIELRRIGIGKLRAFLDPDDDEDRRRLEYLAHWTDDPPPPPASVDWLDITWWAESVAKAAEKFVAAKAAFEKLPAGADPVKDAGFMHARKALADALLNMSKKEHSAFTPGWPLAVMNEIARGQAKLMLHAVWDGKTQFDLPAKVTAVA